MNTKTSHLNDKEFLRQFEERTLDPQYFDHLGHIRLVWLYLADHSLEDTLALTCKGIKEYAESLGDTEKFHLTLTHAMVRIIAARRAALIDQSWDSFLEQNPDLLVDFRQVLHCHYSEELLASDEARVRLLAADIQSI